VEETAVPYAFDPELAAAVPMLPDTDLSDLPAARAALAEVLGQWPAPDETGVAVEDVTVPGAPGDPDVPLRLYRPERVTGPAAVYNIHGGGFVVGSVDLDHALCLHLSRELGVVVVSVDYRLAPETPYPGPLEDVFAGLVWTAKHADELGIDPRRIAVHGTSAGAGLAAGLTLLARDRGGPDLAFQFLAEPEVDDRLATPSMTAYTDTPIWHRPNAVISWDSYLGPGVPGGDGVPAYAAPARATDLAGLPPAYVSVMHYDPLRDEGIAYALALLDAGVTVELHLFPATFHGSALIQHAAISQRALGEAVVVLRRALDL
jgi:acetyl esterase/lipase